MMDKAQLAIFILGIEFKFKVTEELDVFFPYEKHKNKL